MCELATSERPRSGGADQHQLPAMPRCRRRAAAQIAMAPGAGHAGNHPSTATCPAASSLITILTCCLRHAGFHAGTCQMLLTQSVLEAEQFRVDQGFEQCALVGVVLPPVATAISFYDGRDDLPAPRPAVKVGPNELWTGDALHGTGWPTARCPPWPIRGDRQIRRRQDRGPPGSSLRNTSALGHRWAGRIRTHRLRAGFWPRTRRR